MECNLLKLKQIGVRSVIMRQSIVFHSMEILKVVRNVKTLFIALVGIKFIPNQDTGDKII